MKYGIAAVLCAVIFIGCLGEAMQAKISIPGKWELEKMTDTEGEEKGVDLFLNLFEALGGKIILDFQSNGDVRFDGKFFKFLSDIEDSESSELKWSIENKEGEAFLKISDGQDDELIPIVSVSNEELILLVNEDGLLGGGMHLVFTKIAK